MAGEPSERGFVISLPGVNDIIAIPPMDDLQLKRERISRWKLRAVNSPVPEALQTLPALINWLDDKQDMLIFALLAGKFLLRKLPSRFIPYIGWALLANDVLNLFTAVTSAPLSPRSKKIEFYKFTTAAVAGKAARVRAAEAFLLPGRFKWLPFALTGGQVLYSFTGYGLKLGTIMGCASDVFWGIIRSLMGHQVTIDGPPAGDLIFKAARSLSRNSYWNAASRFFNHQELQLALLADNIAASVLGAPLISNEVTLRLDEMADIEMPNYHPWHPVSVEALRLEGYTEPFPTRHPIPILNQNPTFSEATRASIAADPFTDVGLAYELRPHTQDFPWGNMATEFAQWSWDVWANGYDFIVPTASPMEKMLSIALETGVTPPFMYYPEDQAQKDRLTELKIQRLPEGYCFTTPGPGNWYNPDMQIEPIYPPPDEDPNVQLAHWCAVALALYCGYPILLPVLVPRSGCVYEIAAFSVNKEKWGMGSPYMAAGLVWGRNLPRFQYPDPKYDPTKPDPPRICVNVGYKLPGLSGLKPEIDPLAAILAAFPPVELTRKMEGTYVAKFFEPKGRDWLAQYMQTLDPFRRLGASPPTGSLPTDVPWTTFSP